MPTPTFLETGTDATQGLEFWSASSGTVSSSTDVLHIGPRVLKLGTNTIASVTKVFTGGVLLNAGRLTYYYRASIVGGQDRIVIVQTPSTIGRRFALERTAGHTLQVRTGAGGGAQLGSNGSTLSLNTWYRIAIAWTVTDETTFTIKIYVNGVLDISTTNSGTLALNNDDNALVIGNTDVSGTTYVDDLYVDDATTLDDPGDIRVTTKLPASNNVNQFTTAIGANPANRWTNVDERALSETNGWLDAVNANRENYGIQAAAVGDVDLTGATLVARCAWVWAKATVGGLGSPKITNNGVDTAIVLAATSKLFTNLVDSASYPSAADTIGMVSAGVADTTSLYECGMLIAYLPVQNTNITPRTAVRIG